MPLDTSTPKTREKPARLVKSTQEMSSLRTRQFHPQAPFALSGGSRRSSTLPSTVSKRHESSIDPSRKASQPKKRLRQGAGYVVSPINNLNKEKERENAGGMSPQPLRSRRIRTQVLIDDPARQLKSAPAGLDIRPDKIIIRTPDSHIYQYPFEGIRMSQNSVGLDRVKIDISGPSDTYAHIALEMRRRDYHALTNRVRDVKHENTDESSLKSGYKWSTLLGQIRDRDLHEEVFAVKFSSPLPSAVEWKTHRGVMKVLEKGLWFTSYDGEPFIVDWPDVSLTATPPRALDGRKAGNDYRFVFRGLSELTSEFQGELELFTDEENKQSFDELVRSIYPRALRKVDRSGRTIDFPQMVPRGANAANVDSKADFSNEVLKRGDVQNQSKPLESTPYEHLVKTQPTKSTPVEPKSFYGADHESTPVRITRTSLDTKSPSALLSSLPAVSPKLSSATKSLRRLSLSGSARPQISSPIGRPTLERTKQADDVKKPRQELQRTKKIYIEDDADLIEAASPTKRRQARKKEEVEAPREPTESDYEKLLGLGYQQFSYDFWDKRSTDIHIEDIARLEPHVFLNDTLISFFLKRALEKLATSEPAVASNILVLNTFFFTRISKQREVPDWVAKNPLLKKKVIIMPIHETLHWKVAIIVGLDELDNGRKPIICILDSLGGANSRAAYRKVVSSLCKVIEAQGHEPVSPKSFTNVTAAVPVQPNYTDCGVFLVHYVERILGQFNEFLIHLSEAGEDGDFEHPQFWNPDELEGKREAMLAEIKRLGEELSRKEDSRLGEETFSSSQVVRTVPVRRSPESEPDGHSDCSDDGLEILEVSSIKERRRIERQQAKAAKLALQAEKRQQEANATNDLSAEGQLHISRLRPRRQPQFPDSSKLVSPIAEIPVRSGDEIQDQEFQVGSIREHEQRAIQ